MKSSFDSFDQFIEYSKTGAGYICPDWCKDLERLYYITDYIYNKTKLKEVDYKVIAYVEAYSIRRLRYSNYYIHWFYDSGIINFLNFKTVYKTLLVEDIKKIFNAECLNKIDKLYVSSLNEYETRYIKNAENISKKWYESWKKSEDYNVMKSVTEKDRNLVKKIYEYDMWM